MPLTRGVSNGGLSSIGISGGFGATYSITSSDFVLSTNGFSGSAGLMLLWNDFVHP